MIRRFVILYVLGSLLLVGRTGVAESDSADLVIYGGTAGGIVSAVSAALEGATVIIIEPTEHVGGMVTGGLGRTDIGVWETIGGMSAEFYQRVGEHYRDPAAWKYENREDFLADDWIRERMPGPEWWYHEPSVASKLFGEMLAEVNLEVLTSHRLQSVEMKDQRIVSLTCENGDRFFGKIFIDATYEGDLLAMAGVSYRVGRESTDEYGEKYAGVLP